MKLTPIKANMTEEQEIKLGKQLVEVLHLRTKRLNGRIETTWGDKTILGLYRTVYAIVNMTYVGLGGK